MNGQPHVSVIIPNYNGRHFLEGCLASLEESSYPADRFEVILVDNGSSDGSSEYVRRHFPAVRIVQLDSNYGFCRPSNEGARVARGEYLAFLNNDTVVSREWLSELVAGAETDSEVVSCASKIMCQDSPDVINAAGGKITIHGGGFYIGFGDPDGPAFNQPTQTGFGCGAGVLVRKSFFEFIGGFDEAYFAGLEENDLGWKSWLFGHKVAYIPTAVMYHKIGGTFGTVGGFQADKVYTITKNRLCNIVKNFEMKNVARGMIVGLVFDFYRAMLYLSRGNWESVRAMGTGYIHFGGRLRTLLGQRRFVQQNRVRSDRELYKLGVVATMRESIAEERRLQRVLNHDRFVARAKVLLNTSDGKSVAPDEDLRAVVRRLAARRGGDRAQRRSTSTTLSDELGE